MIRLLIASAMICIVATPSSARPSSKKWQTARGCDAMGPCYGNWNPLYGSAEYAGWHSHHVAIRHRVRHNSHRRIPVGLARVMAEGAGRAVGLIRSASGARGACCRPCHRRFSMSGVGS
jgi:hypothetical protein